MRSLPVMESRAGYWLLEMELNTLLDILHPNTTPANLTRSGNLETRCRQDIHGVDLNDLTCVG